VGCTPDDVSALFLKDYSRLCRTIARVLGGDSSAAEQVVMDAFVVLFGRLDRVRPETAAAYLWRVAINEARTVATRARREHQLVDLAARRGSLPRERPDDTRTAAETSVELAHVRALVDGLPVDQRLVVVLHYYCDWPDERIASTLGCPAVTVRSRLRRARQALGRQLSARGESA
jgi:RNA polymerase sigma-70 factor (ECF subfamily)